MNTDEERLRTALHHHAGQIEPRTGSRESIQERLEAARRRRRRGWAAGTTGAVAAAVLLVVAVASLGGGGGQLVETRPAAPPGSVPASPDPEVGPAPAGDTPVSGIWPFHTQAQLDTYRQSGDRSYHDPVDVARAFATEYLGMADPVVGDPVGPEPGGTHTVVVQPRSEGGRPLAPGTMETVVYLDPKGPPWQVLAATSTNIRLDGNRYFQNALASPLAVSGEATAYEGTVQIEVRQAGMEAGEALGRDFVTAGALGNFGLFATEIPFDPPTAEGFGALVLYTESAMDGTTQEATVVGLTFGNGSPTLPPTTTPLGQSEITVFFHRGEDLVPVTRSVPATTGVLRASLEQLLVGPTDAERASGLRSLFSEDAAGRLRDVTIDDEGNVMVDFNRQVVSNGAGTSAGSTALLEQLNATVFQFPTVSSVEYRTDGNCEVFYMAMEQSCEVVKRPGGG